MHRFYIPSALSAGQLLDLPENVVRHLNVLRLRAHEEIVLFNGNGRAYPARLAVLEKRRAQVEVLGEGAADSEPPLRIMLVQAVSGGERMDFTLQKSVELGVAQIRPVISGRSVVRLSGERAEKRVARWQEIVVSACEQCGRNTVPQVLPLLPYCEALESLPEGVRLLMSTAQARSLQSISPAPRELVFMVGPEGGWTAEEEQQAFDAGFAAIRLGPRVLRTETASLAAIAAMQTLWGDFS